MRAPSLAELVMRFFADEPESLDMMTLVRMEDITETITDGRFIAATASAEAIYGRKMDGSTPSWISLTQPLDIFLKSREMWAARQIDLSMPTRYITDILTPTGQRVPILKSTKEFAIDGARYWLTRLKPAAEDPTAPHINDIEVKVDGLSAANMVGKMCLAEVLAYFNDPTLYNHARSREEDRQKKYLTDSDDTANMYLVKDKLAVLESDTELETHTEAITLSPSATGKTQRPHFVHHCSECGGSWVGVSEDPPKCIYCESRLWRGYSKWQSRRRERDN